VTHDVLSYAASLLCLWLIGAVPPPEGAERPSLAAVREGFRYARSRQELIGTYAVDFVAMVFGMPLALFPAVSDGGELRTFRKLVQLLVFAHGFAADSSTVALRWSVNTTRLLGSNGRGQLSSFPSTAPANACCSREADAEVAQDERCVSESQDGSVARLDPESGPHCSFHFSNNPDLRLRTLTPMDTGSRILDGKTAVVTGATRGVGRRIGHELARCGARVFVTGRSVPAQGRRDGMTTMLRCEIGRMTRPIR
jgi:hypothetical protein